MTYKKQINVSNNISEDIQKIIQNIEIDDCIICVKPNSNIQLDKYKFVTILNAADEHYIVESPREYSNLIIGGITDVIDFDTIKVNKYVYCVDNDNIKMGAYIKQSTLLPFYASIDHNPSYVYSIGKIIHVFEENIYVNDKGDQKTKEEYLKSIISNMPKINITKPSNHLIDIKTRQMPHVSIRRISSATRQSAREPQLTPKPILSRTTSQVSSKTQKIYKLTLIKYM